MAKRREYKLVVTKGYIGLGQVPNYTPAGEGFVFDNTEISLEVEERYRSLGVVATYVPPTAPDQMVLVDPDQT